jgi:hypothetical protein
MVLLVIFTGIIVALGSLFGWMMWAASDITSSAAFNTVTRFVNPAPTNTPVSLANGTLLQSSSYPKGPGSLRITNGTSRDAVAKLKERDGGQRTVAYIYVAAYRDAVLPAIGSGSFILQFVTGFDWDEAVSVFRANPRASQFEQPFVFAETDSASGTTSHRIEVTLNPVPGGTARTESIDLSSFAKN